MSYDRFAGEPSGEQAGPRRPRRRSRVDPLGAALLLLALAGLLFYLTVQSRGEVSQSARVQSRGVERAVTVVSAKTTEHTGKHEHGYYTTDIRATVSPAVSGHTETTVHVYGIDNPEPGAHLTALLDPDHPDYAELPGKPLAAKDPGAEWTGTLTGACVALLAAAFFGWRWARGRRLSAG